jgi:hypothetical protein
MNKPLSILATLSVAFGLLVGCSGSEPTSPTLPALEEPAMAIAEQSVTVKCSQIFGPDVRGVIVTTRGGTPSVFTCTGGIFNNPPTGFQLMIPCSQFFGEAVEGRIIFTQGGVSVFTCRFT